MAGKIKHQQMLEESVISDPLDARYVQFLSHYGNWAIITSFVDHDEHLATAGSNALPDI